MLLMRLSALARGLYLLLRTTASYMREVASSVTFISSNSSYSYRTSDDDNSLSDSSGIQWNNLVSSYSLGVA